MQANGMRKGAFWAWVSVGRRRTVLLVLCFLLGVLFLLFGATGKGGEQESVSETGQMSFAELRAYQKELEKEVEGLCESVAGVSQAQVMVTLAGGPSVRYAIDDRGEVVTVGSGSAEHALYQSVEPPVVLGVGVVCHGAQDPAVVKRLVDLLSTTLGISAARVSVAPK